MNSERKMLYIAVAVNFIIGIIIGLVLFYGQMRNNPAVFEGNYAYSTQIGTEDFFRVSWFNILWMLFIFIAHNMLPSPFMHPIIALRGCATAFSLMYVLNFVGMRAAVVSALPQCFSVLPLLAVFSVKLVVKRKNLIMEGEEPFSLRRSDMLIILVFAMLAGGAESLLFRVLGTFLF